jgi:hypothetical protein
VTPEQISLVTALAFGIQGPSISKDEFLRRWPAADGSRLGRDLLAEALADRNGGDLEYALIVGFAFGLTADYLPLLTEAAHADWHQRHEDVAQCLSTLGSEEALPALAALATARPGYAMDIDDAVALARHALHGIERIGGTQARALIAAALDDEREPVRANARRMLDRM